MSVGSGIHPVQSSPIQHIALSVPICSKLFNYDLAMLGWSGNSPEMVRKWPGRVRKWSGNARKWSKMVRKWSKMVRKCP